MADSLLDFGNVARLAQGNLQNAMQMHQMGLQEQQLAESTRQHSLNADLRQQEMGLQRKRLLIDEASHAVSVKNAETARVNSIKSIMDSDIVQSNPALQDQLFVPIANELGIPTEGLTDTLTQSRADRLQLLKATTDRDPQKSSDAIMKLVYSLPPDKMATAIKNFESVGLIHGKLQQAKQVMEMNESKFAELRQNQAIVNEGRAPLTALSSVLRDQTKVFSDPSYLKAQKLYKTLGRASILDPADKTLSSKEKEPLQNLMMGNADRLAENLEPEIMRWQHQLDTANRALIDMDHGITQPGQMKEQLTARVATAGPILGALRDMQAAYRDPLNSEKAELAKHAYKTIEARRVELETMDKKLDAQRMGLVNLANEKFDYKQSQDSALAEAQRRFLALPDKQRNGAAAGRISKAIQDELGVDVLPEKIYKDPNAPQNSTTITNVMGKAETAYATEFNQNLAKKDIELYDQAVKAPEIHDRAGRVIDLLTNQKTITGAGADFRLSMAKALKVAGLSDSDAPENTEALFTDLSSNTLSQIKASGLGSGNGFSNADREYLEKATGGRISLEKGSLLKIAKIAQRVQELSVDRWNKRVKQLPDSALQPGGISRDPMAIPKYQPTTPQQNSSPSGKAAPSSGKVAQQEQGGIANIKSDAEFNKLPSGAIFVGPDGKKRRKP